MKVAVLGSTGLIGKNVIKLLARLDQAVRVYCPVRKLPGTEGSPDLASMGVTQGASKLDFDVVDLVPLVPTAMGIRNCLRAFLAAMP